MPKKAFGWSRRYVCWAFELPKLAQVAWGAQGGNKMDFIIITGMSGAGKSRAVDPWRISDFSVSIISHPN